jgi:hypothetical protein
MSDAHPFDATTPDARRASPQAELATPPAPASGPAADAVDPALVEEAIALVRRWLSEAEVAARPTRRASASRAS